MDNISSGVVMLNSWSKEGSRLYRKCDRKVKVRHKTKTLFYKHTRVFTKYTVQFQKVIKKHLLLSLHFTENLERDEASSHNLALAPVIRSPHASNS